MKSKISHIEINVLNYAEAIRFYDLVLLPIGIKRVNCTKNFTAYSDGQTKIILGPMEEKYKEAGFHRKRAGLNHLAFYADTREEVDRYSNEVLLANNIDILYEGKPEGDDEYYAVLFEGPDRLKLEFVFAPKYCDENSWPCNIEDDFDPYEVKTNI